MLKQIPERPGCFSVITEDCYTVGYYNQSCYFDCFSINSILFLIIGVCSDDQGSAYPNMVSQL